MNQPKTFNKFQCTNVSKFQVYTLIINGGKIIYQAHKHNSK